MTRQNPDSKLKKQDDKKPVKGQSKGGLEKERGASNEDMGPAHGLNGTLNNRRSQHEIFKMFRGQLGPLMEIYRSIEFACVAARHGSEWILISGKAVLSTEPCAPRAQIGQVVKLEDIVALEGRIPAEGYKKLEDALRESWVVRDAEEISVRLTPKGALAYIWQEPKVIESMSCSKLWGRALALKGCYPCLPSLRSDYNLEKSNLDLYSITSPYNGFDGLCSKLGLPARLSKLTSLLRFQVSAELPARVSKVGFADGAKGIYFSCLGTPDLKVKGYPRPVVERIPATSWDREPSNVACRAPLLMPDDADGADVILSFGEHEADDASFDLDPNHASELSVGEPSDFSIVHEVLKDDEDICDLRKSQELVKREAVPASAGNHWHSNPTPEMAAFVAVVKPNATRHIKEILEALDEKHIKLPSRAAYERFNSWTEAYRLGGKTLQARIRTRVTKAKKY